MFIESFCLKNNVLYNIFSKWYKDTRRKVVEVQVDGVPPSFVTSSAERPSPASVKCPFRILLDLRISTGLHIHQKNLSYQSFRALIDKLEVLCWMWQAWSFYYIRDFTGMRCKHSRILSVIREQLHREPSDGMYSSSCPRTAGLCVCSALTIAPTAFLRGSLFRAISLWRL